MKREDDSATVHADEWSYSAKSGRAWMHLERLLRRKPNPLAEEIEFGPRKGGNATNYPRNSAVNGREGQTPSFYRCRRLVSGVRRRNGHVNGALYSALHVCFFPCQTYSATTNSRSCLWYNLPWCGGHVQINAVAAVSESILVLSHLVRVLSLGRRR